MLNNTSLPSIQRSGGEYNLRTQHTNNESSPNLQRSEGEYNLRPRQTRTVALRKAPAELDLSKRLERKPNHPDLTARSLDLTTRSVISIQELKATKAETNLLNN